jgi:hypothetical protein
LRVEAGGLTVVARNLESNSSLEPLIQNKRKNKGQAYETVKQRAAG